MNNKVTLKDYMGTKHNTTGPSTLSGQFNTLLTFKPENKLHMFLRKNIQSK